MDKNFNAIELLRDLDEALENESPLIICGGMALALAFGSGRSTFDIDVIAPVPLDKKIKSAVAHVGLIHKMGENWLNDDCKGFGEYLMPGWKERLIPVDLGFKKLKLYSVGKIDLLVLKLRAGRTKDYIDIDHLGITQKESDQIIRRLDLIARFDTATAMRIKLYLEEKFSA